MIRTYTMTVKPDSDALSAIRRFDPEAMIECDSYNEREEKFTILTALSIEALLEAAPGMIEWTNENELAQQAYDEMNRRIFASVAENSK